MSASTGFGTAAGLPGNLPPADATALLPEPAAPGRARRLRLPRSPKILIGLATLIGFVILAVIGPWIAPYDPSASLSTTNGVPQPPSAAHWLGTTQVQQDVFSQLLTGGRSTVLVAFLAGVVATILAVVLGVTAGYLGGLSDDLLSMLANFFLVIPALPLLIVIFGFLPSAGGGNDLLIGLIIAVTGWALGARVLRAQTLSLRNRDYVESARIAGERTWRIIGFEIVPNLVPILASLVPVHRAVRRRHLHRHGVPRADQPEPLELGRHAVPGAAAAGRGQRLVVVVPAAGHRGGASSARRWRCSTSASTSSSTPGSGRRACPGGGPSGRARPRYRAAYTLGVTPVVRAHDEGGQR